MFAEHLGMDAREKGLWAERVVAEQLSRAGWRVLAQRWRTPFAEVDLFVRRGIEDALVEVKTVTHQAFLGGRLSPRQTERLLRAREYCQSRSGRPTRLLLAWVGPRGEIQLFNLPDGGIE